MFGFKATDYDKKVYEEELVDFLPDKIVDTHTHVYLEEHKKPKTKKYANAWVEMVSPGCSIEDLEQTYLDLFPGKKTIPVIFGTPSGYVDESNAYISKVAAGKLECLSVFGDDYATPDGTGVRDYIHVVDLALAHLKALDYTATMKGIDYFNIGTGNGYSVLEMVKAFSEAWGSDVKYKISPRRPGDIAECYADSTKAKEILGWEATRDLKVMCEDSARWQRMNPDGYPD